MAAVLWAVPTARGQGVKSAEDAKATSDRQIVRVRAGSDKPLKDSKGNEWLPDKESKDGGFVGGDTIQRPELKIENTKDPDIYRAEHYSMDSFSWKVPSGKYNIPNGMTYGQLCPYLHGKGFALHNLASLPHISIAGACSTATHGSGEKNGNLATAVSALEIVTAAGEVVTLSRRDDGDTFAGAVVRIPNSRSVATSSSSSFPAESKVLERMGMVFFFSTTPWRRCSSFSRSPRWIMNSIDSP
jgi:hypothetical protein